MTITSSPEFFSMNEKKQDITYYLRKYEIPDEVVTEIHDKLYNIVMDQAEDN